MHLQAALVHMEQRVREAKRAGEKRAGERSRGWGEGGGGRRLRSGGRAPRTDQHAHRRQGLGELEREGDRGGEEGGKKGGREEGGSEGGRGMVACGSQKEGKKRHDNKSSESDTYWFDPCQQEPNVRAQSRS